MLVNADYSLIQQVLTKYLFSNTDRFSQLTLYLLRYYNIYKQIVYLLRLQQKKTLVTSFLNCCRRPIFYLVVFKK